MKTFRDYAEADKRILEGYTVAKVCIGINAEDTGLMMELERVIDNVMIGVDIIYNPAHEEGETELMISNEYVKHIV